MVGSAALAAQLKQAGQPRKLMVSLEMLTYTSPSQNDPHPAMRAVYGDRGDTRPTMRLAHKTQCWLSFQPIDTR